MTLSLPNDTIRLISERERERVLIKRVAEIFLEKKIPKRMDVNEGLPSPKGEDKDDVQKLMFRTKAKEKKEN